MREDAARGEVGVEVAAVELRIELRATIDEAAGDRSADVARVVVDRLASAAETLAGVRES